ncbi:MAG: hypothetical protein ACRBBU_02970 [Pseudooceanicola sp.]
MARKFIATILASSIAITAFTAPARAGNNDNLVRFLAGATALVIIGKALEGSGSHSAKPQYKVYGYGTNPKPHHDHGRKYSHGNKHHGKPHKSSNHDIRRMPESCRLSMRTSSGMITGYGYKCVQKFPRVAGRIPGHCVTAAKSKHGPRFVYTTRCLQRAGYNVR